MQWSEVVNERLLSIDKINCKIKFGTLKWQHTTGRAAKLTPAPEFALIPRESVREYAHLVRRDFVNDMLNNSCPRKAGPMNCCEEMDG